MSRVVATSIFAICVFVTALFGGQWVLNWRPEMPKFEVDAPTKTEPTKLRVGSRVRYTYEYGSIPRGTIGVVTGMLGSCDVFGDEGFKVEWEVTDEWRCSHGWAFVVVK